MPANRSTFTEVNCFRWKPLLDSMVVALQTGSKAARLLPADSLFGTRRNGLIKPLTAVGQITDALKYLIEKWDYMFKVYPEIFKKPMKKDGKLLLNEQGRMVFSENLEWPVEAYVDLKHNITVRRAEEAGVEIIFKNIYNVDAIKNSNVGLNWLTPIQEWLIGSSPAFVRRGMSFSAQDIDQIKAMVGQDNSILIAELTPNSISLVRL